MAWLVVRPRDLPACSAARRGVEGGTGVLVPVPVAGSWPARGWGAQSWPAQRTGAQAAVGHGGDVSLLMALARRRSWGVASWRGQ